MVNNYNVFYIPNIEVQKRKIKGDKNLYVFMSVIHHRLNVKRAL